MPKPQKVFLMFGSWASLICYSNHCTFSIEIWTLHRLLLLNWKKSGRARVPGQTTGGSCQSWRWERRNRFERTSHHSSWYLLVRRSRDSVPPATPAGTQLRPGTSRGPRSFSAFQFLIKMMFSISNDVLFFQKVDIYSLGIIFFEMCSPPLTTGMERVKVLGDLRSDGVLLPENFSFGSTTPQVQIIK